MVNSIYNLMQQSNLCQVCFTKPSYAQEHQEMIICKTCKASTHIYCYKPNADPQKFICDSCINKNEKPCCICQNPGLLKKIGHNYAHPLCLLFNPSVIVNRFDDLTFVQLQNWRPSKKLKCSRCKKTNGNVVKCNLLCDNASHLYCAVKSFSIDQNKGWRFYLDKIQQNSCNYSATILTMISKAIGNHNKFLKKKLNHHKHQKYIETYGLYCEEHSSTIVECHCREYNDQKIDWIFCQGCLKWCHCDCVGEQIEKKEDFVCLQCKSWKGWIKSKSLSIPNEFPKMYLNDYIYLHCFIQKHIEEYAEKPHEALQLMHSLPLLPGRVFINTIYRKFLIIQQKNKTDLSVFKKNVSYVDQIQKISQLLYKQRQKIELIWWLIQGQIFQVSSIKKVYNQMIQNECNVKEMIETLDLLIKYEQIAFIKNPDILLSVRNKLIKNIQKGNDHMKKYESQDAHNNDILQIKATKEKIIKYAPSNGQSLEKTIKDNKENSFNLSKFNQNLKILAERIRGNGNLDIKSSVVQEIFKLIKKNQTSSFNRMLPACPLTQGAILFDNHNDLQEYLRGVSQIQYLHQSWLKLNDNISKMNMLQKLIQQQRLITLSQCFVYQNITNHKKQQIAMLLSKKWQSYEKISQIPSKKYYLTTQCNILLHLNLDTISLKLLNELIKINKIKTNNLYFNKNDITINIYLQTFKKMLQDLKAIEFNKKSLTWINDCNENIKVKSLDIDHRHNLIQNILQEYLRLYRFTEEIIGSEKTYDSQSSNQCFFMHMKRLTPNSQEDSHLRQQNNHENRIKIKSFFGKQDGNLIELKHKIHKNMKYFSEIKSIRLHFFKNEIIEVLKARWLWIVTKVSERSILFTSQEQIKLMHYWCNFFQVSSEKIKAFLELDEQFLAKLSLLPMQFRCPLEVNELQLQLQSYDKFNEKYGLMFRNDKVKIILIWIDLYYMITNKISPNVFTIDNHDKYSNIKPEDIQLAHQLPYCSSQKIHFSLLKDIFQAMNSFQFPKCYFYAKVQKMVEAGQMVMERFDQVLSLCNWGFSLKSQIEWDGKMPLSLFKEIKEEMRKYYFSFQGQLFQMDIIESLFYETEKKANLFLIDSRKYNRFTSSYKKEKIKELLVAYGSYPIHSINTEILLNTLRNPKILSMPVDICGFIEQICTSHHFASWSQAQSLRQELCSLQFKDKDESLKKLQALIELSKRLNNSLSLIIWKFDQQKLFLDQEISNMAKIEQDYDKMQLEDEILTIIIDQYKSYLKVSHYENKSMPISKYNWVKCKFLLNQMSNLSKCFHTEPITQYRDKVAKQKEDLQRLNLHLKYREQMKKRCLKDDRSRDTSSKSDIR